MNHVRLSVRLSTPGCTTLYERVLGYPSMDFIFLWHMERTYIGAVIICEKSQKLYFSDFLKNSDFGDLA